MKFSRKSLPAMAIGLLALGYVSPGIAGVITGNLGSLPATVSGTFSNNSTALEDTFTLMAPASVTAYTTSYATGGFQPNLELFSSAGAFISSQAFSSARAVTDPTTGLALDSVLTGNLAAGSYILLLTEFDYQLDPSVTTLTPTALFDAPIFPGFADEVGDSRSGAFALTITSSAAPEPATIWLVLASGMAAVFLTKSRVSPGRAAFRSERAVSCCVKPS